MQDRKTHVSRVTWQILIHSVHIFNYFKSPILPMDTTSVDKKVVIYIIFIYFFFFYNWTFQVVKLFVSLYLVVSNINRMITHMISWLKDLFSFCNSCALHIVISLDLDICGLFEMVCYCLWMVVDVFEVVADRWF